MAARVLVVEDEDLLADIILVRLRENGFLAQASRDGPSAIVNALSDPPDLLLCDIWLPGLDGLEVIRALRAAGAAYPIIVMTASRYGDETEMALELGAVAALHKPFPFNLLLSTVQTHLRAAASGPDVTR